MTVSEKLKQEIDCMQDRKPIGAYWRFLGYRAHMGAGSITSNVKSDKTLVVVKNGAERIETGMKKFGAILGDCVEVGCNSVLNPGSVIGRRASVYPTSSVRGQVPADSIYKSAEEIVKRD